MLNASNRGQLFPNAGNRSSWSSSGDTSYYDARDHLTGDESADHDADDRAPAGSVNPAFVGVVETSHDLQAAHDLATAYYHDNPAYTRDNGNVSGGGGNGSLNALYRKKQQQAKKQKAKKARQPYHLTHETNVDSTTTADEAESGREVGNEAGDDFGFKYRPAIPPPRPLLQSPGKQQVSLTLQDTLSMKRPAEPAATPVLAQANTSSGILLETNLDSEMDDNSSIPSSYYPDAMLRQPYLPNYLQQPEHQQMQPNGLHASLSGSRAQQPQQQNLQPPAARVAAAFQFNTAVREEDETTTEESIATTPVAKANQPPQPDSSDGDTATEVDAGRWSESSATAIGIQEEVPRMATWSSRSPSSTVIEAAGHYRSLTSPYKSPTATSLSQSTYSQASPSAKQQQQWKRQQQTPPRMIARLDTDFEVSTDEADFSETTPGDMAILEYSRALEEAERMRHAAAGQYVFAQPPGSQITNSVPEYMNYAGRDSATIGSIGLRGAKSMNTLTSSRNSLRSSGNRELLTPGRARRASLRRSRLGLMDAADGGGGGGGGGGIYTIRIEDSNPVLSSGNSRTNFALESPDFPVPEVQHHGPLRTSTVKPSGPLACCHRCADACCPNAPRKKLFRWLLVGGIVACCVLLAVAIAVIVVSTRPKDPAGST